MGGLGSEPAFPAGAVCLICASKKSLALQEFSFLQIVHSQHEFANLSLGTQEKMGPRVSECHALAPLALELPPEVKLVKATLARTLACG